MDPRRAKVNNHIYRTYHEQSAGTTNSRKLKLAYIVWGYAVITAAVTLCSGRLSPGSGGVRGGVEVG